MNKLDKTYTDLLQDILDNGVIKQDRTGTGTISVFGRQIRHKMSDGFPLLTTKKMPFKIIVTELLWFLRGDTNIKYLVDNGCNVWNGDAYKNYCNAYPDAEKTFQYEGSTIDVRKMTQEEFINEIKTDDEFAKKWGELGPIYGKQWRSWRVGKGIETSLKTEDGEPIYEAGSMYIDQIANLINELKTNPDSRRLMVNAWNVGEIGEMILPPCHYGFQVYTRELSNKEKVDWVIDNCYETGMERYFVEQMTDEQFHNDYFNTPKRSISLMYNARSQDVPLGTPFNISSYALLLEIIGEMVNMIPDELIANMGDCHIYLNQIDGIKEQLTREPFELPKLVMSNQINFNESVDEFLNSCLITDFIVENYQSHPTIKMPLSN